MVTRERLSELYYEVICKCFCSQEVPARVIELMKNGKNELDAIRIIMIDRIQNSSENLLRMGITLEEITAVCEDLRKPIQATRVKDPSVNLSRVKSRVNYHGGFCRATGIKLSFRIPEERREEWARCLVQHKLTSNVELAKKIIFEWLDNQEGEPR